MLRGRRTGPVRPVFIPTNQYIDKEENKGKYRPVARQKYALVLFVLIAVGCVAFVVKYLDTSSIPPIQAVYSPTKETRLVARGRFPSYGTPSFDDTCKWVGSSDVLQLEPTCTYFVRPSEKSNEGVSMWAYLIAKAYIMAKRDGCKVIFDYGKGIDITKVLTPFKGDQFHDWRVPPGFECEQESCSIAGKPEFGNGIVPHYRFAYNVKSSRIKQGQFSELEQALDGFQVETGMACSLGPMFQLAPTASNFEPQLFTRILPTLRDPETLAINLYIRSHFTDDRLKNASVEENMENYRDMTEEYVKCALSLEKEHLSNTSGVEFSQVAWMVVSDCKFTPKNMNAFSINGRLKSFLLLCAAQVIKHYIADLYDGKEANSKNRAVLRRRVLTTESRGIHTKPNIQPTTSDFAEAFIDWYLIGESDMAIVPHSSTFGFTGGLRTARPIYGSHACTRKVLVH